MVCLENNAVCFTRLRFRVNLNLHFATNLPFIDNHVQITTDYHEKRGDDHIAVLADSNNMLT